MSTCLIAGVESSQASEQSYRRGVNQALAMAAILVRAGCTAEDLGWLCEESFQMRCDHQAHPAYLDELLKRFRRRQKLQCKAM